MDTKPLLNALKNILTEENFKRFQEKFGEKDGETMKYLLSLYHNTFNGDNEKINTYFEILIGVKKPEKEDIAITIESIDEAIESKEKAIEMLKRIKNKLILLSLEQSDKE